MDTRTTGTILFAALFICGCGQPAADSNSGSTTPVDRTVAAPPEQQDEPVAAATDPPDQGRETLPTDDNETASTTPGAPSSTAESPTLISGATTLTLMPWEGIQQHIAGNLQGKVVVVNLWATYCVPCRESFPGLVALSQQDPENIVCLSVSLDDPDDEEKRSEALQFLDEQQATFTNFLCTTDADTLYDEILKIGGAPTVYVYGRDGQLAKQFTGPSPDGEAHNYEDHITPFATELAAQTAAD